MQRTIKHAFRHCKSILALCLGVGCGRAASYLIVTKLVPRPYDDVVNVIISTAGWTALAYVLFTYIQLQVLHNNREDHVRNAQQLLMALRFMEDDPHKCNILDAALRRFHGATNASNSADHRRSGEAAQTAVPPVAGGIVQLAPEKSGLHLPN